MFTFFRRYQRFFFLGITIVIVLSFSFFGTYSTLQSPTVDTTVIAQDVGGRDIRASTLQDYSSFLGLESDDLSFGNTTGCNPLNPGIISKEIIATGLYKAFQPQLSTTYKLLEEKQERELKFKPLPQLQHIWGYFAPQIVDNLKVLQVSPLLGEDLLKQKVALFISERQFPPMTSYQALQYLFGQGAARVDPTQLSLFGYSSLEDWFGKAFIQSAALFIYNAARIAELRDIQVSHDEATIYVVEQAQSFIENNPYAKALGYSSVSGIISDTTKRLGFDQPQLFSIVRDILLFKKLFLQIETAAISPRLPFQQLERVGGQYVDLELFGLPATLDIKTQDQLCKIQYWIDAVGVNNASIPSQGGWRKQLALPQETKSVEEVRKNHPQLVQRRFYVEWSTISIDELKENISLKSIWNWQVSDHGWKLLTTEFPEIREFEIHEDRIHGSSISQQVAMQEARFSHLETLSKALRARINDWSCGEMVKENQELLITSLKAVTPKREEVSVRLQKSVLPFAGIENSSAFEQLLDAASIAEEYPPLRCYTQDNKTFIRVVVLDKSQDYEIVPLQQALHDGTLESLLEAVLEASYKKIRNQEPKKYLEESGEWKPLSVVRQEVSEVQFKSLFIALEQAKEFYKPLYPTFCSWDSAAEYRRALRFFPHVLSTYEKLQQDLSTLSEYTTDEKGHIEEGFITEPQGKKLDFRLVRRKDHVIRSERKGPFTTNELFSNQQQAQTQQQLQVQNWLSPHFSPTDGPIFARIEGRGEDLVQDKIAKRVIEASQLLGRELGIAYASSIAQSMNLEVTTPEVYVQNERH